jgi:two-component system sensor histidine kinase HydH
VCEPFFTTRQEGTGLGLAIAKRYIEQNGGRMEIVSRPGEGTTVRLRLPTERTA